MKYEGSVVWSSEIHFFGLPMEKAGLGILRQFKMSRGVNRLKISELPIQTEEVGFSILIEGNNFDLHQIGNLKMGTKIYI